MDRLVVERMRPDRFWSARVRVRTLARAGARGTCSSEASSLGEELRLGLERADFEGSDRSYDNMIYCVCIQLSPASLSRSPYLSIYLLPSPSLPLHLSTSIPLSKLVSITSSKVRRHLPGLSESNRATRAVVNRTRLVTGRWFSRS